MDPSEKKVPRYVVPRGFVGSLMLASMNLMHRAIYANAARALSLQPDDDLLEIACGNGHFLKKYASEVRSIAGLDLSPLAVEKAERRNKERVADGTAVFVQGDASKLPWPEGSFTAATAMGSFVWFAEPLETLREMWRVLRPRGRAVILIESSAEDGVDHSTEAEKYGMRVWAESEIRQAMADSGFAETTVSYAKGAGFPRMMIVRALKL